MNWGIRWKGRQGKSSFSKRRVEVVEANQKENLSSFLQNFMTQVKKMNRNLRLLILIQIFFGDVKKDLTKFFEEIERIWSKSLHKVIFGVNCSVWIIFGTGQLEILLRKSDTKNPLF